MYPSFFAMVYDRWIKTKSRPACGKGRACDRLWFHLFARDLALRPSRIVSAAEDKRTLK
jgi:hypothetical protein